MITGAQALIKGLEQEGVQVVFGYPGAAICPFYDILEGSGIRHILVRQEQNAGHAASGYARLTGAPGVCIATSGPGAANLIPALATAYMDSVPLVAITGQVHSELLGRDVFQEADITGAAEPFTKYSFLVKEAKDLFQTVKEAFYLAGSGRPGPVLIDVPINVQQQLTEDQTLKSVQIRGYKPTTKGHAMQIKRVAEAILEAKRPVLCAGGGVFASHAQKEMVEFCRRFSIPAVTTMMGLGIFPQDFPLSFGMIGLYGTNAANKAVLNSDLLILIGARVGDRAVASPEILNTRTKIVHIDIDPAEIGKNMAVDIPVVGDVKVILGQLSERLHPLQTKDWLVQIRSEQRQKRLYCRKGFVNPRQFFQSLSEHVEENTVLVADVGQNQIWAANWFAAPGSRFLTSGGMGTMGYAIPAAMGAKLAKPERQVFAVCGDGSFQMSMMELGTLCQDNVDIKIILFNNSSLGLVRELQKEEYQNHLAAVQLQNPDFVALAKCYQIPAMLVQEDGQTKEAIDFLLSQPGRCLLEIRVSPDEPTM